MKWFRYFSKINNYIDPLFARNYSVSYIWYALKFEHLYWSLLVRNSSVYLVYYVCFLNKCHIWNSPFLFNRRVNRVIHKLRWIITLFRELVFFKKIKLNILEEHSHPGNAKFYLKKKKTFSSKHHFTYFTFSLDNISQIPIFNLHSITLK